MEVFGKNLLLQERLGVGGMGEIFRARMYGSDGFTKTVAVKRIKPELTAELDFRKMFHREANFAARLSHPNIVQVFSNGTSQNCLYLVMEYVHGVNLRQLVKKHLEARRYLPIPLAIHIAAEAAKGLAYAHELKDLSTGENFKIVHKDVSPHNLMLGFAGEVKLVDFGIAQTTQDSNATRARSSMDSGLDDESHSGTIKGKIAYMSPEQLSGLKLDGRSDLFGLGIVLWELLTLRRLFSRSRNVLMTDQAEIADPSSFNKHVPEELDRIVMKAITKDIRERYQSAAEFADDLNRCLHQCFPNFSPSQYKNYIGKVFASEIVEADATIKSSHEEIKRLFGSGIPEPIVFRMQEQTGNVKVNDEGVVEEVTQSRPQRSRSKVTIMPIPSVESDNSFFGAKIKPKKKESNAVWSLCKTFLAKMVPSQRVFTIRNGLRFAVICALHYWLVGLPLPRNYLQATSNFSTMVSEDFVNQRKGIHQFSLDLDLKLQRWATNLGVEQSPKANTRFFHDLSQKLDQIIFGNVSQTHKRKNVLAVENLRSKKK